MVMSDFNLEWAAENFGSSQIVVFDIGCARLSGDSLRVKTALPLATVYAFECSNVWKTVNEIDAKQYGIQYIHKAVSYTDGIQTFYPSKFNHRGELHDYAGSLRNPETIGYPREWWGESCTVESVALDTFCQANNVVPKLLLMDVEGEEYNILHSSSVLPKAIWLEYNRNYNCHDGTPKTFNDLRDMLIQRGYCLKYRNQHDALFVLHDSHTTPYVNYTPLEFNKHLLDKIWLMRYRLIKDITWPELTVPNDFFTLPQHIIDECINDFNLVPCP
jgi:FkbM family methyltransferase